ncbi:MAG TPA: type IV secretion system protein VirB10 [Steroidobacteraceae bacterium]|nr:type IV secretion system protein VirB10 [Steroidobacteraceae bacterium]
MARARSLQTRLSSVLAMILCAALGLGLLAWYYGGMLAQHRSAPGPVKPTGAAPADNTLPPLGPIRDFRERRSSDPEPRLPVMSPAVPAVEEPLSQSVAAASTPAAAPRESPLERRLAGPAFASTSGVASVAVATAVPAAASAPEQRSGGLADLLTPTVLSAATARELPTQRLLLPKGAFIDCTLETAIDSTLPGMTTCITATDTFSADGTVVLLERGSKLIGETRGQVQQGGSRLFVLWTEARTPTGIIVPLVSPGTDALGRSGLDGEVERHFWQRFGAAILISVVDAGAQAAQRSAGSGTVIYDTSSSQGVATEALRDTIGIGPTLTKHQGDRIQILVARDLDFRPVYQLRESEATHR